MTRRPDATQRRGHPRGKRRRQRTRKNVKSNLKSSFIFSRGLLWSRLFADKASRGRSRNRWSFRPAAPARPSMPPATASLSGRPGSPDGHAMQPRQLSRTVRHSSRPARIVLARSPASPSVAAGIVLRRQRPCPLVPARAQGSMRSRRASRPPRDRGGRRASRPPRDREGLRGRAAQPACRASSVTSLALHRRQSRPPLPPASSSVADGLAPLCRPRAPGSGRSHRASRPPRVVAG